MGYCSMCGKQINAAAGFCSDCKAKLAKKEDYMDNLLKSMSQSDASPLYDMVKKKEKKDEIVIEESDDVNPQDIFSSGTQSEETLTQNIIDSDISEQESVEGENMADNKDINDSIDFESDNEQIFDEGAAFDELFAKSDDKVDYHEIKDINTDNDDELDFSLDDLMLDDAGNDAPTDENFNDDRQSISSGNEEVLVDNDILSMDNLDESGGSMGDVFSDALSALSSEQDAEETNEDVSLLLDNSKKTRKKKKSEKKGVLSNLFSNVVDEKEISKAKEEKKAEEQAEKKKEQDEEKKKEQEEQKVKAKAEAKEAKSKGKETKAQQKLEKKQAKKEEKELRELEEEAEIEGRINKIGASVVFIVLLLITLFVVVGTKLFSYSNSISNAESYLKKGLYVESYNELLGVDIKEKDKIIYQKVITVMYVYKQLEAYDVYYKESRYPDALDSLLKGIREYEKYMPDAIELDVSANLDSVKNQIVNELVTEYGITEDMAKEINQITDRNEYSQRVYDLAQNLASNNY